MDDVLKNGLDSVWNRGLDAKRVVKVHEDDTTITNLVMVDSGKYIEQEYAKPAAQFRIELDTLDSFVAFANEFVETADLGQVVVVGDKSVDCLYNWPTRTNRRARCAFTPSAQFSALRRLKQVRQQDMVRALQVHLRPPFVDKALLSQFSGLSFTDKKSGGLKIDDAGLYDATMGRKLSIRVEGREGEIPFRTDWSFSIPVYELSAAAYTFETRIQAEVDRDELAFTVSILNEEEVLEQVRRDIAETVRKGVPEGVPVYLGTISE